jgi:hypothetical protein
MAMPRRVGRLGVVTPRLNVTSTETRLEIPGAEARRVHLFVAHPHRHLVMRRNHRTNSSGETNNHHRDN